MVSQSEKYLNQATARTLGTQRYKESTQYMVQAQEPTPRYTPAKMLGAAMHTTAVAVY
jgi:hypothetical protein